MKSRLSHWVYEVFSCFTALAVLPTEGIPATFEYFSAKAFDVDRRLGKFSGDVRRHWIHNITPLGSAVFRAVLDMLTLGWPDLNPRAIPMDYEEGLMNTFGAYFPTAEIHGCFFHLV